MILTWRRLLLALLLSAASTAGAAGLGKLAVLSAMGEPFRAEIDLLGVTDGEERAVLTPRLAPPAMYSFADFRYNPALTGASLDVRARSNGRRVIEIISAQPVSEPFVYLLVELESNTMRMVRGYTALLDPHGYHAPRGTVMATEFPPGMISAIAVPAVISAISSAPRHVPASDRARPAARRMQGSITQPDTTAKTLAGMLQRVAALEVAVAQLQRRLETPDAAVAAHKPAAEEPSLRQPVESKKIPEAVSAQPAPTPAKPVAPVESAPRHASAQDSLLNTALLGLVIGLLLLLGGLVYVMRGRPAAQA